MAKLQGRHFLRPVKIAYAYLAIAGIVLALPCIAAGLFVSDKNTDWFGISAVGGGVALLGLVLEGLRRLLASRAYPAEGYVAKQPIGERQIISRRRAMQGTQSPAAVVHAERASTSEPAHRVAEYPLVSRLDENGVTFRSRCGWGMIGATILGLIWSAVLGDILLNSRLADLFVGRRPLLPLGPFLLVGAMAAITRRITVRSGEPGLRTTTLGWFGGRTGCDAFANVVISIYRGTDKRYEIIALSLLRCDGRYMDLAAYPTFQPASTRITKAAAVLGSIMGIPILLQGEYTGTNANLETELATLVA